MLDLFSMDSEVKLFLIKIKVEASISFSISTFSGIQSIEQGA